MPIEQDGKTTRVHRGLGHPPFPKAPNEVIFFPSKPLLAFPDKVPLSTAILWTSVLWKVGDFEVVYCSATWPLLSKSIVFAEGASRRRSEAVS